MNQGILLMYITAVETGRFTIDFVPAPYRNEVKKALKRQEMND